jgi:hypothetical protein
MAGLAEALHLFFVGAACFAPSFDVVGFPPVIE